MRLHIIYHHYQHHQHQPEDVHLGTRPTPRIAQLPRTLHWHPPDACNFYNVIRRQKWEGERVVSP